MKLGYYPGCTLYSTAKEYNLSTISVFKSLGIELAEISDWNCCGAIEAASLNYLLSIALPARNLTIASREYQTLIMPCSACLANHTKAFKELKGDPVLQERIKKIINAEIKDIELKHPLDVLVNDIDMEKIKEKIKKPLNGLKVVSYYGCVLVRPSRVMQFDNPENPQYLDKIITALGAESLPYDFKTKCCGGALMLTNEDLTLQMSKNILVSAKEIGAQCIVLLCPMCHLTLESLSFKLELKLKLNLEMPILYFTQLIGLGFGINPKLLGLNKNLISTYKLVKSIL